MTDVVGKLWGFCHVLRHDGMDYGDYIEQLTFLLFLKMADERGIDLPSYAEANEQTGKIEQIPCDWPYLRKQSGTQSDHALHQGAGSARKRTRHPRRHLCRRAEPVQQAGQPEQAHRPH